MNRKFATLWYDDDGEFVAIALEDRFEKEQELLRANVLLDAAIAVGTCYQSACRDLNELVGHAEHHRTISQAEQQRAA